MRILRGRALDNLPDDPNAMLGYLRLLAPRSAGPFGPAIIVDGFQGGGLPPKSSIREIRINDNPFAAEYSEVGLSRIEVLTRPGTEVWQSAVYLNFNDESLNSRNTFAPTRIPFQNRLFGVSTSGPVIRDKLTFSFEASRAELDDNVIVNAAIVDSAFRIQPLNEALLKPTRSTNGSTGFNFQMSENNTVVAKYLFSDGHASNEGVGALSLQSRAFDSFNRTHTLQLTETAILGSSAINETRFQYIGRRNRAEGNDSVPTTSVPGAFESGGSGVGRSISRGDTVSFRNYTTWIRDNHGFKIGAGMRTARVASQPSDNRAGTYLFSGRIAPRLDGNDEVALDSNGQLIFESITNIESYRRTLVFQGTGLSPDRVRSLGGGATLFSLSTESDVVGIRQYEFDAFVQDDWRARESLSFNFGLRLETQNNLSGTKVDIAPRLGVAWEPLSGTVFRAGSGVFFDRFSEDLVLQSSLSNGTFRSQFIASDAGVLAHFPDPVPIEFLTGSSVLPQTVWNLAESLRAPYQIHSSFSIEQLLPFDSVLAATFTHTRGVHTLRSRNLNAPLNGIRPFPDRGEIFQYESSGVADQKELLINTSHNFNESTVLWSTYTLSNTRNDTDGPSMFPADPYDLRNEYGRAASDARHTFYAGGWLSIFGGIELTPLVMWRSGLPFNITTGRDSNGDSQFTERPALASDLTRSTVIRTPLGAFDVDPEPGQSIIARNAGTGPSFAVFNLRLMKMFEVSPPGIAADGTMSSSPRMMMLAVQVQNLFNHTNLGAPIGNLSSPLFGQSLSAAGDFGFGSNSAGTRRVELSVFFSF